MKKIIKPNKKRARILKKAEKKPVINDVIFTLRRLKKRIKYTPKVFISEEYSAVYFPITKIASTSLEKSLKKIGFESKKYKDIKNLQKYKFKFAFVRNPYDRLVSCYVDKIKKPSESGVIAEAPKKIEEDMTFKEFIKAIHSIKDEDSDKHFQSQYYFLTDLKGKLIPDFIGKFENLEEDFKKICKKIGIKDPLKLSHARKSKRKKDYRDYYDEETKKLVQERYKKDFELFGYSKEF